MWRYKADFLISIAFILLISFKTEHTEKDTLTFCGMYAEYTNKKINAPPPLNEIIGYQISEMTGLEG